MHTNLTAPLSKEKQEQLVLLESIGATICWHNVQGIHACGNAHALDVALRNLLLSPQMHKCLQEMQGSMMTNVDVAKENKHVFSSSNVSKSEWELKNMRQQKVEAFSMSYKVPQKSNGTVSILIIFKKINYNAAW